MSRLPKPAPGTELLADLAAQIAAQLTRAGLSDSQSADIGQAVSRRMADHWGGQMIYFPKGMFLHLSARDRDIYELFDGSNHKELARQFGVSEQHIYRIVKIMRRRDLDDRISDLFDPS